MKSGRLDDLRMLSLALALPDVMPLMIGGMSFLSQPSQAYYALGVGMSFFIASRCAYARSKGLNPAWGLLGMSCFLGPVVLKFPRRSCGSCSEACPDSCRTCPACGCPL